MTGILRRACGGSAALGAALAGGLALLVGTAHAAAPGCRGEISASRLEEISPGAPIVLEVINQDSVNATLVDRFSAGLQQGGTPVSPQGKLHLRLTFLLRDSQTNGVYPDFSWLENPNAAGGPLTGNGPRPAITVTATLTDPADETMVWIASVDCVVQTKDPATLAFDLGRQIGRLVGKDQSLEKF